MIDLSTFINTLPKFASCSLFKKKVPLEIFQRVTYRCNLKCTYCGLWRATREEMSTERVKKAMKEFGKAGTKFWEFGGGEPLLRDDIGELIDYAKKQGISFTHLVTNGFFFEKRMDELKNLTDLCISLDGPKEVHEKVRGKSYDEAVKAIRLARSSGFKPIVMSVLSKYNVANDFYGLKWIFDFARKEDVQLVVQPIFPHHYCNDILNSIEPNKEETIKALEQVKKFKEENGIIRNSEAVYDIWIQGLRGNLPNLKCWGGIAFASLFPDGSMAPCFYKEPSRIKVNGSFLETFKKLPKMQNCRCISCYNENNLLYSLDVRAVSNTFLKKLNFWS